MSIFYYHLYRFFIKAGIIKLRQHPEQQGDMFVMVIEPKWFWQK